MDHDLRRLARGGDNDPSAWARVLRSRLRSGDIPEERVRLAAYLGDEAALLAWPTLEVLPGIETFNSWIYAAHSCGREAVVRLSLALDRADHRIDRADVEGVEAWLEDPDSQAARSLAFRYEGLAARAILERVPQEIVRFHLELIGFDDKPQVVSMDCDATYQAAHRLGRRLAQVPVGAPARVALITEVVPWLLR
jgi:hypothetical protein